MPIDPRIYTEFERRTGFPLRPGLVMAALVGSTSHGTYVPSGALDDTDYFLVVMPPFHSLVGLDPWEGISFMLDELDVVCYSYHKYVRLLMKSNPNVVGTLWLRNEDYLFRSTEFKGLQDNRDWFVTKQIFYSFGGYADGQFKKLLSNAYQGYMGAERKKLFDRFGYDPKNLAHVIRLYRMGIECLKTGRLNVYRPDAAELVAIKQGGWGTGDDALQRIANARDVLNEELKKAYADSSLPEEMPVDLIKKMVMTRTLVHIIGMLAGHPTEEYVRVE